ncbi:uncharacterized protein LOC127104927 [Lathyrus oleraceus]|uniref:uncharacterized protein LOC127104927 n=1 Tax=Pisum sativum TaxID=3888 RepID=UPI0021D1A28C|nr:uncharacterized protein LOC127104927 [Pisum sativum]
MQPQDPLEEIDLGDGTTKRPTYISANIDLNVRFEQRIGGIETVNKVEGKSIQADAYAVCARGHVQDKGGDRKTPEKKVHKSRKAMKGQVVADFIVDHSIVETPLNYLEPELLKLYFNGSNHKNGTGIGILIISPNKIPTKFKYRIEGTCSNNEAEYEALIAGLEILLDLGEKRVKVRGNSEVVVKQVKKEYGCIKENLIMYFIIVNRLIMCFDFVDVQHVPQLEN